MATAVHIPRTAPPDYFGAFVPDGLFRHGPTGRGPLCGLTFAVKDLIDVAGKRTGGGNPAWLKQQQPAARSAPVVDRALAAGATLIGKTVTDELAFSLEGRNIHYGSPINPACPDRLCGGSSSGSAVAVAGGLADFAFGTDTGGSVRVPANFVGVFGFRPSHGAVPLDGVMPFAPSYDTIGWFARSADILAAVGEVLLPRQPRPAPIAKLLLANDAFTLVEQALAEELKQRAEPWGPFTGVDVFAGEDAVYLEAYRVLQDAEVWQSLGDWLTANRMPLANDIAARFAGAATVTRDRIAQCRPVRAAIRDRIAALAPPGTAIVLPATPCAALPKNVSGAAIGDFYARALRLTSIAGHAGAPQVTLPLGHWHHAPIGLSLIAAPGSDRALLDLAVTLAAGCNRMTLE
jgi:amidase